MKKVGLIGWRGMVGSVLVQRMQAEQDFDLITPVFFSTSQAGGKGPAIGGTVPLVRDARDVRTRGHGHPHFMPGSDFTRKSTRNCAPRLGRLLDRRQDSEDEGRAVIV
jgi:aspartate-semialdehyde dehydrogenase